MPQSAFEKLYLRDKQRQLKVVGAEHVGTSKEFIEIKVTNDCNLGNFLIMDNTIEDGEPSNLLPHVYRFDQIPVFEGDTIYLITQGDRNDDDIPKHTSLNEGKRKIKLYWGLNKRTVWNKGGDVVHVIEIAQENSYELLSSN